jgi:protein-S-isoprenylcysteine O-methyltransferase Ste14
MTMTNTNPSNSPDQKTQAGHFQLTKALPGMIFTILLPFVCLILISGQWGWWQGWALLSITSLATIGGRYLLIKKQPDLANERVNYKEKSGTQSWDMKLMPIVAIFGPLAIWITAGLDKRFSASVPLPAVIEITALLLVAAAYAFSTWAMLENRFFAAVVRIQTDRHHLVIESGPYRLVRHPGYAGSFIASLLIPLALGTFWVYIPALLTNLVVCIRTAKEDQFLQAELSGYTAYTQKTRYRLIPGIW